MTAAAGKTSRQRAQEEEAAGKEIAAPKRSTGRASAKDSFFDKDGDIIDDPIAKTFRQHFPNIKSITVEEGCSKVGVKAVMSGLIECAKAHPTVAARLGKLELKREGSGGETRTDWRNAQWEMQISSLGKHGANYESLVSYYNSVRPAGYQITRADLLQRSILKGAMSEPYGPAKYVAYHEFGHILHAVAFYPKGAPSDSSLWIQQLLNARHMFNSPTGDYVESGRFWMGRGINRRDAKEAKDWFSDTVSRYGAHSGFPEAFAEAFALSRVYKGKNPFTNGYDKFRWSEWEAVIKELSAMAKTKQPRYVRGKPGVFAKGFENICQGYNYLTGWSMKDENGDIWPARPPDDIDDEDDEVEKSEIIKVDEDKQIVYGWAYQAFDPDGTLRVDKQGDFIDDPAELEDAAHNFVRFFGDGDMLHDEKPIARVVESVVFTPEKIEKLGLKGQVPVGWWVGLKILDDGVWQQVKDGKLRAFSIGGSGVREEVDLSLEKHYPGGQDHNQQRHAGGKGPGPLNRDAQGPGAHLPASGTPLPRNRSLQGEQGTVTDEEYAAGKRPPGMSPHRPGFDRSRRIDLPKHPRWQDLTREERMKLDPRKEGEPPRRRARIPKAKLDEAKRRSYDEREKSYKALSLAELRELAQGKGIKTGGKSKRRIVRELMALPSDKIVVSTRRKPGQKKFTPSEGPTRSYIGEQKWRAATGQTEPPKYRPGDSIGLGETLGQGSPRAPHTAPNVPVRRITRFRRIRKLYLSFLAKGESGGHYFRGNRYTGGLRHGDGLSRAIRQKKIKEAMNRSSREMNNG